MIEIREMVLRIPGFSAREGEWMGAEVARLLADQLPEGIGTRHLEQLHLRVALPPQTSRVRMAGLISTAILGQLQSGTTNETGPETRGRPSGHFRPAGPVKSK